MTKKMPSIFNEVVGPIMRGCSSSHVAAGLRIGLIARDLAAGQPQGATVFFDSNQPLAASYDGQGSAMGFSGGLLGMAADCPDLENARKLASEKSIDIQFVVEDLSTEHPNTYIVRVDKEDGNQVSMEALSLGGGAIEITRLFDFSVSLAGDLFVAAFLCPQSHDFGIEGLTEKAHAAGINITRISCHQHHTGREALYLLEAREPLPSDFVVSTIDYLGACDHTLINAVMPVLAGANKQLPFKTVKKMLAYSDGKLSLADLAYCYEERRSGYSRGELRAMMGTIADVMYNSIQEGIKGTEYKDRILPPQAPLAIDAVHSSQLSGGHLQKTIAYVSALMDIKSAMGLIVAAPTGGACGALGGAVWSAVETLGKNRDDAIDALMAAGIIGVFIAKDATFAGEEGGCQAECGSGSAMAAAALVYLMGGTVKESVDAAAMALQNTLGLVCDTVADRVEFPCLGRNVMAATNAISCSTMAMAGYSNVIPLSQTIGAMADICQRIPIELRCTGKAGLATTTAAQAIQERL